MSPQENKSNNENANRQYYALLVGINDYPEPISTLGGCLNDLDQIENFLRTQVNSNLTVSNSQTVSGLPIKTYGFLNICRLENEKATYHNIIKGFREFLRSASPDDVVWFHFSGHGSEQFTAEEFLDLEPNGKDQTLVCFQSNPEDGHLHLADKELAVLLHEVDSLDLNGQPKKSPHIVVTMDCCHSGSGTRDFEFNAQLKCRKLELGFVKTRTEAAEKKHAIRPIDTYADGYYATQIKSNKPLEVPSSSHILLAACESVQLAGDLPQGGIFTSSLVATLHKTQGKINYADLYTRTRATVQKVRPRDQTPQFNIIGNFDPFTRFLEGSELGKAEHYEVLREGSSWYVKCGSIHGVPVHTTQAIFMEIRTLPPENKSLGMVELISVGAQKSKLDINEKLLLEPDKQYQAFMKFLPAPPVLVWVHGEESGVTMIRNVWDTSKNISLVENLDEFEEAQLEVEVTASMYRIKDRRTEHQVTEWPVDSDNAESIVVDILGKMVNWERTISLQNEKSAIKDWIEFEMEVAKDPRQPFMTIKKNETIIKVDTTNFLEKDGALAVIFIPRIRLLKKVEQNLYFYLLHLRPNYAITSYEGEVVYRPEEYKFNRSVEIPLWKTLRAWGIGPEESETTSYFKLLVTTEPLDYHQLLQSGIEGDRFLRMTHRDNSVKNEWYSITFKVILERSD